MTARMRRRSPRQRKAGQRGLTLIEVLISVVILLAALLGAAGLIARSNQSEMESYQRVQALTLLQDMVTRLNANRQAAACYAVAGTMTTAGNGGTSVPSCTTGTAAQQTLAQADLAAWGTELMGSAESSGASAVGAMIGARGCIEAIDTTNQIYRVTVAWQGLAKTVSPSLPCGSGGFTNDAYRRAVSVQVRIGVLS
ncbi:MULTISPECIES: type IV pilus modification protein PilV [Ralstonia solanacearum species complex]|uniref:Putative type 4 fimbrial biogenesis pilv-related transmembrane protein n=1 Tax=Ralstonia syzygii R24 TaxID=907261 RepID=G3A170_9RALS|nr:MULTISPECIES: type IV pilus modification protein PilV [Ralstonia solanacearum species complex]AMP36693.1 type IV pilus modification protein PilV [Ralstonia solanacearum]AXV85496.1 type IV pilus modification protein PilV [Ralstonia solanacearum]AXW05009.1 type IV pilus modification protein PilV [Ralstonia solanacearum]AXW22755.1 type IV pilus modification protein PilV [Ralstonia solanacearum]AXW61232.1 type IV pilus modification protein PilV [Ralstonia solanacearum]